MPSISEAVGADLSSYHPVGTPKVPVGAPPPPVDIAYPGYNPMLRCPFPPIWTSSSDSQRQFFQFGRIPQSRILSPSPSIVNANPVSTSSSGSSSSSSSSSTSGSTANTSGGNSFINQTGKLIQASVTTALLSPGQQWAGIIPMSKAFQLIGLSSVSACRVRLYGTQIAQTGDYSRGVDVPPPAGTVQNIICDIALDTNPFQWAFQNRLGTSGNSPQTTILYVTVTNLGASSRPVTITLQYVPLEG